MISEKEVELEIKFDTIFSNCTIENLGHIYNCVDKLLNESFNKRIKELKNNKLY